MKGIGIIIDAIAIILGCSLGVMIKYEFPAWVKRLILQGIGFAALLFGAYSLLFDGWFSAETIGVEIEGSFLIVVALLMGGLFGEALRLDRGLDKLGAALRKFDSRSAVTKKDIKAKSAELRSGDRFVEGFTTATILCAFSTMAFTATLSACLDGDNKTILIKAAVDAVVVFLLAKVYGTGAGFAVVPTLTVEGILAIVATARTAWLTPAYVLHLTIISSVILIVEGINLAFDKRLKVVNLLPAFFIGPLYWWAIKTADLKK